MRRAAKVDAERSCKVCRARYAPTKPMQAVCSLDCAIAAAAKVKAKTAREQRRITAVALAKLKTRGELIKAAQKAFNAYIRARDAGLPCVSCGRYHQGQWHAGHYMSTGARPDLRFDESNVHKQCAPCNKYLSGNLVAYRAELIRRIGQADVERLEGPANPGKLERHEIIELKSVYAAKRKALG